MCCLIVVAVLQVAAVERMLTDIDELPEQFKSAEIVYLSKNCLTHLQVSCTHFCVLCYPRPPAAKVTSQQQQLMHLMAHSRMAALRSCDPVQGVQQFARLRVLSAADNLLPDISCLEVLAACPNLQVNQGLQQPPAQAQWPCTFPERL